MWQAHTVRDIGCTDISQRYWNDRAFQLFLLVPYYIIIFLKSQVVLTWQQVTVDWLLPLKGNMIRYCQIGRSDIKRYDSLYMNILCLNFNSVPFGESNISIYGATSGCLFQSILLLLLFASPRAYQFWTSANIVLHNVLSFVTLSKS